MQHMQLSYMRNKKKQHKILVKQNGNPQINQTENVEQLQGSDSKTRLRFPEVCRSLEISLKNVLCFRNS